MNVSASSEVATLAGGCFWCLEAVFSDLEGVERVIPGYAGGTTASPSYEQVSTGRTGHAESVQVTFDPALISYREVLEIFFSVHDPTTLNRQGADVGTQYRSAIFYHDEKQQATAAEVIKKLDRAGAWDSPIVTEVAPLEKFYPAEEYHHEYYKKHPELAYCRAVISPKLSKFRRKFGDRLKMS
jgi:peptide-methionine (S)-S-oxide reductase